MAMSLTHSIPDSLTLHCCWKLKHLNLHPQCLTSVWSPGGDFKETWLHLRPKVGWRKENPLLAKYFIRRWKQIILIKLRTFFNFFWNGLTLVPGIATLTRVQAFPLVVCEMIITIACIICMHCISCSVIILCVKFTFKECLTSNAVPYLETISTQRRVRKVRRTCFKND